MDRRFNTKEAARFLGYKNSFTLANWRHKNKGPAYHKIVGKIYYFERDLIDFQNSGRVVPDNKVVA